MMISLIADFIKLFISPEIKISYDYRDFKHFAF